MSTLYELKEDYLKLYEFATSEDYNKDFEQMLQDTKESMDFTLEEKAYNCAKVSKNIKYNIASLNGSKEFLKKELERIESKIKYQEKCDKRLRESLSEVMDIAGVDKFKNEEFTIFHTKTYNTTINDPEKALELGLATTEIKPNKTEIQNMLKAGEELDFAELHIKKVLVIR